MVEDELLLHVEVVYAEPDGVWSRRLRLPQGTTVAAAVDASGFADARPDVQPGDDNLGVFGRRVKAQRILRDGDRVEIYRPLSRDPMEARRQRAQGKR